MLEQIPEPVKKKRRRQKINKLKKKVEGLFDRITRFKPKQRERAFGRFLETYKVEGQKGCDVENLFDDAESKIINLYKSKKKPMKTTFHLNNEYTRTNPITGEVETMTHHFHSEAKVIYESTNISEKYREMRDDILEKVANYHPEESNWQFTQVRYVT